MIDSKFLVEREGKTFALFAGLLDAAHRDGLKRITTTLVQIGHPDNGECWIVHATVETAKGTFDGIGDASPPNVAKSMLHCLPRLAETRAKARALRDAVNAGALVSLEELGADEEHEPAAKTSPTPLRPSSTGAEPATAAQVRAVRTLASERHVNLSAAGVDLEHLTRTDAAGLIARWQGGTSATP